VAAAGPRAVSGSNAFEEASLGLVAALRSVASEDGTYRELRRACASFEALAVPEDLRAEVRAIALQLTAAKTLDARERVADDARARIEPWLRPEFSESLLARPLSVLSGIGPKRAQTFSDRGLHTIEDILFYLPTRYDDRRALAQICDLEVGRRATFIGRINSVDFKSRRIKGRGRRLLEAVINDETGSVNLKWFRALGSLEKEIVRGGVFLVTGDVKRYRFAMEIVHPEMERIEASEVEGAPAADEATHRSVQPSYPLLEGVPPRTVRRLIRSVLLSYSDLVAGQLPAPLVEARKLPAVGPALRLVHAPDLHAELPDYEEFRSPAHERLLLEELYLLQLGLALRRSARARSPGIALGISGERVRAAPHSLPFTLTSAQQRVWDEIGRDLARPHPMNRLLQGDVGSGKTAVALLAAVAVAANGRQTALMAPTELLAEQHARSLAALMAASPRVLGLRLGLLTASVSRAQASEVIEALAAGAIDLVVGTHALIQEKVAYADLALAIIDEQHRFGVLQRAALAGAASGVESPHVLVMTATPIPRTLALTGYGDLELSVIDELPPGRTASETILMQSGDGARVMERIRDATSRGEQVYVVYPLVEESEKIDLRSAVESSEQIARAFPELRVDLVHGRLDAESRERIMASFRRGEIDILVATTVIEVGVDIPNASLMIVEHAERFGLAQLHQLRGRVGRGAVAGTCLLVSRGGGKEAKARLAAMLRTNDGFEIADADLEIRGPGEFLGTRQSGEWVDLRLADLVRDAAMVEVARDAAIATIERDGGLVNSPRLRRAVEAHWSERLALLEVG